MRRRGATLVLVTTIGVIIAILSLSMIQLGWYARLLAVRDVEKVEARCAADAGLSEAFMRMQQKLIRAHQSYPFDWTGPVGPGSGSLAGNNATYSYQVNTMAGHYEIVSTGLCGMASKTVTAVLDLDSYMEGIGVDRSLDAKNSTYFGIVGPGTIQDMKIRSNSTANDAMIFRTNVRVDGDVFCGPGGVPSQVVEVKQNVSIAGQVGASSFTMVWPPISVPTNLVNGPVLTGTMTLPQGRYGYAGNLTLPNNTVISIAADTVNVPPQPTVIYVPDIMRLGQGDEIQVLAGAMLEVYIGQQLVSGNAVGFGNDNTSAASLKIFGLPTCTYIDLKTKSNTYACIYAPDADVDLYNAQNFYGSIVGDTFEMKNSGNFYFDTRLSQVSIDDLLARFVISRWWEG